MRKIIIIQLLVTILLLSCKKDNEEPLCMDFKLEQSTLNNELDYEIMYNTPQKLDNELS